VGYLKAAKLIEMLEDDGIVGPREEGESRPVIAPNAVRDD
jgi:DNA segregation ATPase FtsK/SpoIIIE-like protein